MVLATGLQLTASSLSPFRAIETFPVGLSVIQLAGLNRWLDSSTVAKLRELEDGMRIRVKFAPMLRARTDRGIERAFVQALEAALPYYIESGTLIWRALKHDYSKLRELSSASCKAMEEEFFRYMTRLGEDSFINTVTGIRVWAKVSEWVIAAEESKVPHERMPPLRYLWDAVVATLLTSCLLYYIKGEVRRARGSNLQILASEVRSSGERRYSEAIEQKLHEKVRETQYWYWSPQWQEGEVEADLDRRLGRVRRAASAQDLMYDLKTSDEAHAGRAN